MWFGLVCEWRHLLVALPGELCCCAAAAAAAAAVSSFVLLL